jgi:uncharacterized protein
MIIITSPSKTQDFSLMSNKVKTSEPVMQEQLGSIISEMKKKTKDEILTMMKISHKLAELNFNRFKDFSDHFSESNAKPALFAFQGDVYLGIEVEDYSEEELRFAQKHLRILSGLYGVLKPLDLIQPYRLEMGTRLSVGKSKNLYEFWGDQISKEFNMGSKKNTVILNLASQEYSKAVDRKTLEGMVINVDFKENKEGQYKTIGIFAKRARGKMINFIIRNRLNDVDSIKKFNLDGYRFDEELSDKYNVCFTREV